jgi:hypothetical protein
MNTLHEQIRSQNSLPLTRIKGKKSKFIFLLITSTILCTTSEVWSQTLTQPTIQPNGSVTDGVLTVSNARLAWEPIDNFPVERNSFQFRYIPKPPFALTLTANIVTTLPQRRGPRATGYPGRVYLITQNGRRISGTALRDFADGENAYKWVWNEDSMPDPRDSSFKFSFEYSTALRTGIPVEKERVEWTNIPIKTTTGTEIKLGRPNTEKVTPSGIRIWLESVMVREAKARPNGQMGSGSIKIFGRWLPPATDPAMRITPELTREIGGGTPALVFDNGEASGRVNFTLGREIDVADQTPGWFTVSTPPIENAQNAVLRLSLASISPLKPKPDVNTMLVTLPPATLPPTKTTNLPIPIMQQPLGKGQLQLFAPVLFPENGYTWSWRAPLFLQIAAEDETRWQSTGVFYRVSAGGNGGMSTGLRPHNYWKLDNTPLKVGEVGHQATYFWSQTGNNAEATPPAKIDIDTRWNHIKEEDFTPRFDNLQIPAIGKPSTPDLVQPLGEWGTLTLRKVAAFGPDDDLGARFKKRTEKFFALGGLALVFEHIPPAGKNTGTWDLQNNFARWSINLEEVRDDQNYPLVRGTDASDGRHLPSTNELSTDETPNPNARFITLYTLPPTPNAKKFGVSLRVRHQDILETKAVVFSGVELPR